MKVYPPRDIRPFVMYCVNGKPRSSLLIESTDSMIRPKKHFKNEQRSKDAAATKRPVTDGYTTCKKNKNKNKKPKWRFLTSRGTHVNCAIMAMLYTYTIGNQP